MSLVDHVGGGQAAVRPGRARADDEAYGGVESSLTAPQAFSAAAPQPPSSYRLDAYPGIVSDCRIMLAYAMKNAFVVGAELADQIARLDGVLAAHGLRPISAVNPLLIVPQRPAPGSEGPSIQAMLVTVHTELSALIAPTTALTLQTSEPPPGRARIFGGSPLLVKTVVWVAVASALLFMVSASTITKPTVPASLAEAWWGGVNEFAGAALGASFYVLMRTYPYLANRSYDPKFNAAYISRFIAGVIGGVILATGFGPQLVAKVADMPGHEITPGILALLGGYSAEAVEIVLQRLVDIVTAAVRGDGSVGAKAKLANTQALKRAKIETLLDEAFEAPGQDPPDAAQLKAALMRVRAELRRK